MATTMDSSDDGSHMRWKLWKSDQQKVADFVVGRSPMSRDDFVEGCGVSGSSRNAEIATAVRQAVANLGLVDPAYVYPDDRWPDQLGSLPFWDSLEEFGVCLEFEDTLDVMISEDVWNHHFRSHFRDGFAVRDLVASASQMMEGITPAE